MLFNEPKLLKLKIWYDRAATAVVTVSVLFNEPKLLKYQARPTSTRRRKVSVLFNEPKLLKCTAGAGRDDRVGEVSVLFNEPKLLKSCRRFAVFAFI